MLDDSEPSDAALKISIVEPEQDRGQLAAIAKELEKLLTPGEQITYVVLQQRTAGKRDAVVATSNRLVLYRPGILGRVNFEDYSWQDVKNVHLKQGILGTDISVEAVDGRLGKVGWLDKEQSKRLYSIAQQKEQEWREKRRARQMEESRAAAGGVYVTAPAAGSASGEPTTQGPVEKLAQAKSMLDSGLISESEYESIKAKIIASMT